MDLSGSLQGAGGIGGLLAACHAVDPEGEGGSAVSFFTYDANGNIGQLLDAADPTEILAHYEYSPFGETLVAVGEMAKVNPFRFSTKYHEDESGLVYYGYRFYNPELGRWINRDPIEEEGGLNVYLHTANATINKVDLLGLAVQAEPDVKLVISTVVDAANGLNNITILLQAASSSSAKSVVESVLTDIGTAIKAGTTGPVSGYGIPNEIMGQLADLSTPGDSLTLTGIAGSSIPLISQALTVYSWARWAAAAGTPTKFNTLESRVMSWNQQQNTLACQEVCDAVVDIMADYPHWSSPITRYVSANHCYACMCP